MKGWGILALYVMAGVTVGVALSLITPWPGWLVAFLMGIPFGVYGGSHGALIDRKKAR